MRLDVREEAYLFEQLDTEALGLIYHERRYLPACPPFAKERFEALEEVRLGLTCLWTKIELEGQQPDEVGYVKSRIIQVDASDVAAPLGFEGRPYKRRLTSSGLANQHRERSCREQPVLQDAQRFALPGREEQVFRICSELERELR